MRDEAAATAARYDGPMREIAHALGTVTDAWLVSVGRSDGHLAAAVAERGADAVASGCLAVAISRLRGASQALAAVRAQLEAAEAERRALEAVEVRP